MDLNILNFKTELLSLINRYDLPITVKCYVLQDITSGASMLINDAISIQKKELEELQNDKGQVINETK